MPQQYTRQRRLAMQIVMWVILLAMVGLAGLVSTHRRGVFQTHLDAPLQQEGLSVQLPKGWDVARHSQDDSALLLTAISAKELLRARTVSVWRHWSDTGETPVELVYRQLRRNAATQAGSTVSLAVDGHPAAVARGEYSTDDMMGVALSFYVGAIVPPSGHAVVLEYQCINGDSSDEDLLRRVLQSIKLKDEPAVAESKIDLATAASIHLPEGLAAVACSDPNQTLREARSIDPAGTMKRVQFIPSIYESRDGDNTFRTQLSLTQSGFDDAPVTKISAGEFRIEPAANSADRVVRPIRAYARYSKSGVGLLAIFKGGDNEQWIDEAWSFVRDHTEFRDGIDISDLSRRGEATIKRFAATGLGKLFPEDAQEQWFLASAGARNIGWSRLQPKTGSLGGTVESRILIPQGEVVRALESFQGSGDLKSYRSNCDVSYNLSQEADPPKFTLSTKGSSQLRDGKLTLGSSPVNSAPSSVEMKIPANYLPGGWLIGLLPSLPDEPMLLRTDMAFGYEYASASDLLTIVVRTDPDFKPKSDPDGEAVKCRIVEIVGSGALCRWYLAADNRVISMQCENSQKFSARDESEIRSSFSRNSAMRP
jgi:hypothetical protein